MTDKFRGRLDIKQTLLWLRDAYSQDIDQIAKISGAIDAIELAQIESLIAQERREVLYRFALPFLEGGAGRGRRGRRLVLEERARHFETR